ncbi:virulence associated lipoprotein (plasmid) [Borreliella yangtzensis]|uniref:virulence associated lipoprotein n=1 Tax=Borreliella yangtzensis TaxID=683292 RepID=UPI003B20D8AA
MKYLVIINVFFLLFVVCSPEDFGINKKNIKRPSNKKAVKPKTKTEMDSKKEGNLPIREAFEPSTEVSPEQKEDPNKEIKNKLLNDLNNLIEVANAHKEKYIKIMEKEPDDRYGVAFRAMQLASGKELISGNSEQSRNYRRNFYTILNIDTKDLKEFSSILEPVNRVPDSVIPLAYLGANFDKVIDHLYPKKDTLDKLDISDLEKLKQSLEKVLSIIKIASEKSKQLLLDYRSDKNSIKIDSTKRTSYIDTLSNQIKEKVTEVGNLLDVILAI